MKYYYYLEGELGEQPYSYDGPKDKFLLCIKEDPNSEYDSVYIRKIDLDKESSKELFSKEVKTLAKKYGIKKYKIIFETLSK